MVERKAVNELAIMLDSTATSISRADWDDINQRQTWRRTNSATVDGGALRRHGGSVSDALMLSRTVVRSGLRVGTSVCVFVNGIPKPGLPIDAIRIDDIAFIELFGAIGEATGNLIKNGRLGRRAENGLVGKPAVRVNSYATHWCGLSSARYRTTYRVLRVTLRTDAYATRRNRNAR